MTTLIALAVLAQGFPAGFEGVWITNLGEAVTICSSTIGEALIDDRYYSFNKLQTVPDGSILGQYIASNDVSYNDLDFIRSDPLSWTKPKKGSSYRDAIFNLEYSDLMVNPAMPIVPKPIKANDLGEIRCTWGQPDAYGKYTMFQVTIVNQNNREQTSGKAIYSLGLSDISVAGKWSDGLKTTFDITDDGRTLGGAMTEDGVKCILVGSRVGERGCFYLANPATGRLVGYGAIEWAPTKDRALKIRTKDLKATDRVLVSYTSPNMQSGHRVYLRSDS